MANHRMAASTGAPNPFTIPGTTRTYNCAAGSTLDVPYPDAPRLADAGWIKMGGQGNCQVGPTTSRPTDAVINQLYTDTTVGALIVYNGHGGWLNAYSGASV